MNPSTAELPSALERLEEIEARARDKRLAVFLDYDGTLTPIVDRPELAVLSEQTRDTVRRLAGCLRVAVISGRDLRDVRRLVGIDNIFYAGSHGFEIEGPQGWRLESPEGAELLPVLDEVEGELQQRLRAIPGALVERKKFSVAAHYRLVEPGSLQAVEDAVAQAAGRHPELRRSAGKKVHELQPAIDWNKGKALLWLLEVLELDAADVLPLYLGDDITDEDAFEVMRGAGVGIVIRDEPRPTAAAYGLDNPDEVRRFLESVGALVERA